MEAELAHCIKRKIFCCLQSNGLWLHAGPENVHTTGAFNGQWITICWFVM